jgi:hypothetical protein
VHPTERRRPEGLLEGRSAALQARAEAVEDQCRGEAPALRVQLHTAPAAAALGRPASVVDVLALAQGRATALTFE